MSTATRWLDDLVQRTIPGTAAILAAALAGALGAGAVMALTGSDDATSLVGAQNLPGNPTREASEAFAEVQGSVTMLRNGLVVVATIALVVGTVQTARALVVCQRARREALLARHDRGATSGSMLRRASAGAVVVGVLATALGLLAATVVANLLHFVAQAFGFTASAGPSPLHGAAVAVGVVACLSVASMSLLLPLRNLGSAARLMDGPGILLARRSRMRMASIGAFGAAVTALGGAVFTMGLTGAGPPAGAAVAIGATLLLAGR